MLNKNLILEDTTLRDGEQAPGVAFTPEQKVEIFYLLANMGVKWIEAGIPAMKGDEVKALSEMLERKNEINIIAWNRGVLEDIEYSISLGFKAVHIGLPTSAIHLEKSVKKDKSWLVKTASDLVKFAKDKGMFVSISAEDIGRTDIGFLQEYAQVVAEAGADRLRLSDTIGILSPAQYKEKVSLLNKNVNIDLQCHCHNDFGFAVANTLAGIEAGARYFHVCVNGIGERAGMPDLAQVAMALHFFHGVDLGLDLTKLIALSETVAKYSHQKISPWQPIVGDNVFAHESGIHANGMLKDSSTFEPFDPATVGGERRLVVGKHSGRAIIKHFLEESGVKAADDKALDRCLERVRSHAVRHPGGIPPHVLVDLYTAG